MISINIDIARHTLAKYTSKAEQLKEEQGIDPVAFYFYWLIISTSSLNSPQLD